MKRIFLLLITLIVLLESCSKHKQEVNWYSEIRSANKLVLASMTISKIATIDDIPLSESKGLKQKADAIVSSLKIGDRVAAYSYDTYLKAYIDLSNLMPEDIIIDEKSKTITLLLPQVQTEFAGRDLGMREEHYRVTGLRSQINAKERTALKEKMNSLLKEEVENDPAFKSIITDRAKTKARLYFETLLAESGYTPVVMFKPSVNLKTE